MERKSKLRGFAADIVRMLAIAWGAMPRLTLLYYLTARLTLKLLIDNLVITGPAELPLGIVIVVAMHFAVVAINSAYQRRRQVDDHQVAVPLL